MCCPFTGPVITQIIDCIHLGNIGSGQGLCMNSTDSFISDSFISDIFTDMSCLPSEGSLSVIPYICHGEGSAHTSRLHGDCHGMGQPCFWDTDECIEVSPEKGNCVLIHLHHCVMAKHSMKLLSAYEFMRYLLNIEECCQDLLLGLEPEGMNIMCPKHSLSRKIAWSYMDRVAVLVGSSPE